MLDIKLIRENPEKINELLDKTNDIQLLDLILRILNNSNDSKINPQTHKASA